MNHCSIFTADHHGYYCNRDSFIPLIQEEAFPSEDWSNICRLYLPARLDADLNWSKEEEIAQQVVSLGKYLFWELDLGLSSFKFTPENSAAFFSFSVALEEFVSRLWKKFQKETFGISLYRGQIPSINNFPRADWEISFLDWSSHFSFKEQTFDTLLNSSYELYCVQMLSEYLHRLVSFLPETILPFAQIDVSSIHSPGKIAQLFSKERFEYIQLILKGAQCPFSGIGWSDASHGQGYLGVTKGDKNILSEPKIGLYLPQDIFLNSLLIHQIDRVVFELQSNHVSFRFIPEDKLTEQWDGIDQLFVPSQAVSGQGRRKLCGFYAAGGRIVNFDGVELMP